MKKEEQTLYNELVNKNKYNILRNFLDKNKSDILKALNNKVRYKDIYEVFIERTKLDIDYKYFYQFISDFKKKYIYNLSETEYKEQIKAITQEKQVEKEQPKILATKISESEQSAQPKEQEKIESNTSPACDEKPSSENKDNLVNMPIWKQKGFKSKIEYFNYLQSKPSEEKTTEIKKETFTWKATMKE